MMKLKVIIPNSGMTRETLDQRERMLLRYAWPNTEISVDCIKGGPESIESDYDEVLACPYVVKLAIEAEKDGFDGLIVYCGSDPAVKACREVVNIPVIAPGRVSQMIALDLGYKFSILTVLDTCVSRDTEAVYEKGFPLERLASVRPIGIPVSDIGVDSDTAFMALVAAGRKCIADGAQCIVLSCLGMAGMGEKLQEILGIPVLDPAPISIQYAQTLVRLGLSQSRIAYPKPPEKSRI